MFRCGLSAWGALSSAVALVAVGYVLRSDGVPADAPAAPRRLEVLFLGSENLFNHDPIARFRVIRQALGPEGINFTYSGTLDALTPENLARYDVLLIFANHETIAEPQQDAMLEFARGGGGCVLLHCAAGCFRGSGFDGYVELLGAQFKSHGTGVFRAEVTDPDHPVMQGFGGFECWDETYEHQRESDDRTVLMMRDDEPWTWVKTYGDGRVFYTASGHDHRCWGLPEYHDLIRRAIRWAARDGAVAQLDALNLPELHYRPASVPENPAEPVGPMNRIQLPLTPEESLRHAQVPPGFEIGLFAAEPQVVNPIAMNWDDRGRLWVVEAFDYPHKVVTDTPADRVKILEDTDGDGAADRVTVFADGLNIATSVLPMPGGAIAVTGERIVFLRDSDADDRADGQEVLITGLGLRDTHACTSNLHFGFDNWVYATVGYSGLKVESGGAVHQSEMAVFRFRADGSAFEVLQGTTNNTWGLAITDQGDIIGSTANGNPSWYLSIPNRFFVAAGLEPVKAPRADSEDLAFPITTEYFQNWPKEQFSSAAGHELYSGGRFPDGWANRRALICEPPLHLVAAPQVTDTGAGFKTSGFEQNLYASADAWSSPVAAAPGPDGAVWIADWYNPISNHNPYRPHHERGPGNAFVTGDRDREHGRIYRVFPAGSSGSIRPALDTFEERLAALGDPAQLWRLNAQKLIVSGSPSDAELDELRLAALGDDPRRALHALRALGELSPPGDPGLKNLARTLARSPHRGAAAAAIDLLEPSRANLEILSGLVTDQGAALRVRLAAALALTDLPPDPEAGAALARLALSDAGLEGDLETGVMLASTRHPEGFLRHLIESGVGADDARIGGTLAHLAARIGSGDLALSDGLITYAGESGSPSGALVVASLASPPPPAAVAAPLGASALRGRDAYIACVACHQPDGRGLPPAFPPLAGSPRVSGDPGSLVKLVLVGLEGEIVRDGVRYSGVMPGQGGSLDDVEVADISTYIRAAWGGGAGEVTPADVRAVRRSLGGRLQPIQVEELE